MMGQKKNQNPKTLDLHGLLPEEALDRLDRFLVTESDRGSTQVRVLTGKGKGVILNAVSSYLKKGGFHFSFEKTSNGENNSGSLIVFLT